MKCQFLNRVVYGDSKCTFLACIAILLSATVNVRSEVIHVAPSVTMKWTVRSAQLVVMKIRHLARVLRTMPIKW